MRRKPVYLLLGLLWIDFIYLYGIGASSIYLIVLCLVSLGRFTKQHLSYLMLGVLFAVLSIALFNMRYPESQYIKEARTYTNGATVKILGEVSSKQLLNTNEAWLKTPTHEKYLIRFDKKKPIRWRSGQTYVVSGLLKAPDFQRNTNTFDEGLWLKGLEAQGILYVEALSPQKKCNRIENFRFTIGSQLLMGIMNHTAFLQGPVACGMILGEDDWIDPQLLEAYQKSGTLHILSISGAHFAIFLMWLNRFLNKWGKNYFIKKSMAYSIIFFYVWLIGMPITAVRALVMYYLYESFKIYCVQSDALNALSLTAFIMLLINPFYLGQLGFELACLAMYGLSVLFPFVNQWLNLEVQSRHAVQTLPEWLLHQLKKMIAYVLLNICLSICMAPLLITKLNQFSWWSILYNLPCAILSSLALPLSFLQALTGGFKPLQEGIGILSGATLWLMNQVILTAEYLPNPSIQTSLGIEALFFIFLCLSLMICVKQNEWLYERIQALNQLSKWFLSLSLIIVLIVTLAIPQLFSLGKKELVIQFYDVGQGDAYSLITEARKVMLVDSGLKKMPTPMSGLLAKQGISQIDYFMLSHPHADHIGGALDVIENIPVKELIYFEGHYSPEETAALNVIKTAALKKGTRLHSVCKGDSIQMDKQTSLSILAPKIGTDTTSANDESIAFALHYKEISFVGTGDISETEEYGIMDEIKNTRCLLKVPHHGSKTSSSEALLEKRSIDLAICQVGRKNRYGHPTKEALKRYKKHHIAILRTDLSGAISVISDGIHIRFKTAQSKCKGFWR